MANTLGYQVIKDTTEHTVIKLTGFFVHVGHAQVGMPLKSPIC
jgi:hypothetical protein